MAGFRRTRGVYPPASPRPRPGSSGPWSARWPSWSAAADAATGPAAPGPRTGPGRAGPDGRGPRARCRRPRRAARHRRPGHARRTTRCWPGCCRTRTGRHRGGGGIPPVHRAGPALRQGGGGPHRARHAAGRRAAGSRLSAEDARGLAARAERRPAGPRRDAGHHRGLRARNWRTSTAADPRSAYLQVYDWLTYLQETLVGAGAAG